MWLGLSITHRRTMGFRRSLRFFLSGVNAPAEIWHKNLRGYIYVRRSCDPPCPPCRRWPPYARPCRVPCHTGDQIDSHRGIGGDGVVLFNRCHGGTGAGGRAVSIASLSLVGRLAFFCFLYKDSPRSRRCCYHEPVRNSPGRLWSIWND